MLRFSYRNALSNAANFCAGVGLPLSFTSIPDAAENGNMLSFDTANMKRIFDEGVALDQMQQILTSLLPLGPEPERSKVATDAARLQPTG